MGIADAQNFTQDYQEGGPGGGLQRPTGTGDAGQVWDPIQKRWVPQSQMPAGYDPQAGNRPVDANGLPLISNQQSELGGAPTVGPGATPGRVTAAPSGGHMTGDAWGGYSGTIVKNPDGSLRYDAGLSGANADISRMNGLANTSANAQAPTINYGNANGDAMNGARDRLREDDAITLARTQANGGMTPGQATAWKTLHEGEQAQVAGALSRRGGPLSQVTARHAQVNGASAYNQKGANQIAALRADEMEQGRNTLAGLASQQRSGDVASQYNNANQAINQGNVENTQRDINQLGQLGYTGMGAKVGIAASGQQMTQREQAQGASAAQDTHDQTRAAQDIDYANQQAQFLKKEMSTGAGGGEGGAGGGMPTSDCRAKRRASIVDYLGRK